MRINEDTILLVATVIGIFLLAIIILACSLSGREVRDCSVFRCCCKRRRSTEVDDEPHNFATLNEFIFETDAEDAEQSSGLVDMVPTTMQQVFPDLLGDEEAPNRGNHQGGGNPSNGGGNGNTSLTELSEPLL